MLQVEEAGFAAEVQVPLARVQHVEHDDFVAAVAEVPQPFQHLVRVVHEVGQHHDQAAPGEPLGQIVEGRRHAGVGDRLNPADLPEQNLQVTLDRARRHKGGDLVPEKHQADGVPLLEHQVGQSRSQAGGVAKLAEWTAGLEVHRAADVQQEVGLQIGLLLVLLDVEAVGFGVGLPVQVAQGVAGHVGPVLGKLDREPVVRTAVQTGDEALHDQAGHQIQPAQPRDDFRVEVGGDQVGGIHPLRTSPSIGTCSRRRCTRAEGVIFSASAWKLMTKRWRRTGRARAWTSSMATE